MGIPASIAEDISLGQLKVRRAAVESTAGLDTTNRKTVLNLLDKAIQLRELADKTDLKRDEISQTIKSAPDRLKKFNPELIRLIAGATQTTAAAGLCYRADVEQSLTRAYQCCFVAKDSGESIARQDYPVFRRIIITSPKPSIGI